jgi:preprotein translocase subunit SecF/SecD/SecF fusion protein
MLLGVVIGTYSSIFIAAPVLGYFGIKRDWSDAAAKTVAATKAKAKA